MKILQAGPLQVGYENGFLRRITYGQAEVLRMIYFALRDHNWNTIPGTVANEQLRVDADHFEIEYDYLQRDGERTVMTWKALIRGNGDGSIIFEIAGTVTEDLRKNRAGFCVLHPLTVVDESCMIVHPDESKSTIRFPRHVAPDNPFRQIQKMSWKSDDVSFGLEFEGDIFETEDQRNWGDASFKTFCTPQDIPFPVAMKRGDEVFQRITFKPLAALQPAQQRAAHVELSPGKTAGKLPVIGIGASTEIKILEESALALLRPLRLHHYRIDLYPGEAHWVTDFSEQCEVAYSLGVALEVALHLTENFIEELEAFVVLCQQNRVKLRKVLLLQVNAMVTGQSIIDRIPDLRSRLPNVQFGVGTNYNFNEVNKNRFQAANADYISFSMDPQEHASDDITILENAASPGYLVKSAQAVYGEQKPVHLSPLTLLRRFNPYATNPEDLYIDESRKADPRQKEALAAVWTFACICSLVQGNASAVTLYQTVGNQGILSGAGKPFPVYDVVSKFAPFQKRSVRLLESSDPLAVQGIVLDDKTLGLANLTVEEQTVRWSDTAIVLKPLETRFESLDRAQQP